MPDVEDFVAAFGVPALQALLDCFGELDAAKKESVLNLLLRVEPPLCPKAVLDRALADTCLLYTSPSPRDRTRSRMPSSA